MEFSVESFEKIGESLAMLGDERLAPAFLSHANHDSKSTKLTNVYILSGIELGTDGVAELNSYKIERIPPRIQDSGLAKLATLGSSTFKHAP